MKEEILGVSADHWPELLSVLAKLCFSDSSIFFTVGPILRAGYKLLPKPVSVLSRGWGFSELDKGSHPSVWNASGERDWGGPENVNNSRKERSGLNVSSCPNLSVNFYQFLWDKTWKLMTRSHYIFFKYILR